MEEPMGKKAGERVTRERYRRSSNGIVGGAKLKRKKKKRRRKRRRKREKERGANGKGERGEKSGQRG